MINAIDASPHDPAAAYVAVTKYKFNDFTPLAFKTDDYGKSWTAITDGIAEEDWVRVIREDPKRHGLLYMGTETGIHVSFDDGESWQSLQLNLPVVPITDLKVQARDNDLVAATQGRAFWILDDLSPLQQMSEAGDADVSVHLFAPRPAYRVQQGGRGSPSNVGKNPPNGAIVDFIVAEVDDETTAKLEILDAAGETIRTYATDAEQDDDKLEIEAGMNRTSWDLRHETPESVSGLYIFGSLRGRKVVPGTYQVKLTVRDETRTQPFEVVKDPRVDTTLADFETQDRLLAEIEETVSALHGSVNRLRDVREQIEDFVSRAKEEEGGGAIEEAGDALVEKLTEVEDALIQKRTVDGQTVINFPSRLNHHFTYLRGAVDGSEVGVIDGARERYGDLKAQWDEQNAKLDPLLGAELDAFNTLVREKAIPLVIS